MSHPSRNDGCPGYIYSNLTCVLSINSALIGSCGGLRWGSLEWDGSAWKGSGGDFAETRFSRSNSGSGYVNALSFIYESDGCRFEGGSGNGGSSCSGLLAGAFGLIDNPDCLCGPDDPMTSWEFQVFGGIPDPNYRPPMKCYQCMCSDTCSSAPIDYSTGALAVSASDLPASGFGSSWGHTRSFVSNLPGSQGIGQGYNWQVQQWPFIVAGSDGSLSVLGDPNGSLSFIPVDGEYESFCHEPFAMEEGEDDYQLADSAGTVTVFDKATGMFRSQTAPGGNTIEVTSMAANGYNFTTAQRNATIEGVTTTEEFSYTYVTPYADSLLETVTLRRQVGMGDWTNVTRANYTYYGPDEDHGGLQDLKTVTTQVWDGSDWNDTGTTYYRYYPEYGSGSSSSSSSSGGDAEGWAVHAHLLKFALLPAAYDRMVADELDPLTASDSVLLQYSDNYFEYNDQRRVSLSSLKGGSQTFTFEYDQSGFDDDYNHWKTKTTETLPNGNQNIVYSNYAGQTMLKVFQSGEDQWLEFWRYDENAKVSLHAHASAITGYDEGDADLLNYDSESGSFEFLRDDDGLIDTYTQHVLSGNRASESLQQGQLGASIPVRAWNYCQCGDDCSCSPSSSSSSSSSSGGPDSGGIWFVSRETAYPVDADPDRTIITDHCYSFYDGTCAVKQHKTTLPVVPVEQNGSGIASTNREYFDVYGNLTWKMDERGFISRLAYDIPTGAMVQTVNDVDTGLYEDAPPGWMTPSGGGSNLVTDYEHDDQGRITQTLGPRHPIDLDGEETEIRTASWTVYVDVDHVTYSGQGFATGEAPDYEYTLINPVSITKMDAGGRVNEQIQATAPSTEGTLAEIIEGAGGGEEAFPQSSYTRWTTFQYTDCCLAASQRVYHAIPSSGEGDSGTNYDETDYGYDVMKRRNRTVTPGGTITDLVYEARGMVIGSYVGTNDDGATPTDPTGGGLDPDNNMVIVTANEYDDGAAGGDGNLTEVTQHVNGTTTRVTSMAYDFRNRNVTTDGEVDFFQKLYYDNLNRVVKTERYDTTALGNLIARKETNYDDRGRVFQTIRHAVDPNSGDVGNDLTDNTWFDESVNVIKSLPAGSSLFTKTEYDSLGRTSVQYRGYDLAETGYPG